MLYRMVAVLIVLAAVIVWQQEYLVSLYVDNQVTSIGWVVNGAIVALFLMGFSQLVRLFLLYGQEERTLDNFTQLFDTEDGEGSEHNVPADSLIGKRYKTLLEFSSSRTEINHNALASTLLAEESSRTSFPKFVNNILILTGVFGTIVSLTVALIGASTAISETEGLRGIDVVIHGMSTALSTTMTAILAYFLFGYFYLKLLDTQSYVLGRVEYVTATVLIPRYQAATRPPEQNLSEMLVHTVETLSKFENFINQIQDVNEQQRAMFDQFQNITNQNVALLNDIRRILRAGFRLRDTEDDGTT